MDAVVGWPHFDGFKVCLMDKLCIKYHDRSSYIVCPHVCLLVITKIKLISRVILQNTSTFNGLYSLRLDAIFDLTLVWGYPLITANT